MHTGRIGNWRSCSGDCCRGGRRSRRWQTRTAVAAVSIWPNGGELDKSWLIRADVGVDPGLVTGYSGVDSRQIGPSTAKTKTNNSRLNPPVSLFADHWTSRVTLRRRRGGVWGCQKMGNIVWTSIKQSTWHESFPPARTPAQIMLSVIVPTPFRQLHCLFPTTGTCTSCRVWGNGNDTEETTTWQTVRMEGLMTGTLKSRQRFMKNQQTHLSHSQLPSQWPSRRFHCWTHCHWLPDTLVWCSLWMWPLTRAWAEQYRCCYCRCHSLGVKWSWKHVWTLHLGLFLAGSDGPEKFAIQMCSY